MSKHDGWGVHYSSTMFLKETLERHDAVLTFRRIDDIYFEIVRKNGLPQVNALLINVYRVGIADVHKAVHEFPSLNCIVIGGEWNQYTSEAKDYAIEAKIGLFNFSEFFGSLYSRAPYLYVKKEKNDGGKLVRKTRSS